MSEGLSHHPHPAHRTGAPPNITPDTVKLLAGALANRRVDHMHLYLDDVARDQGPDGTLAICKAMCQHFTFATMLSVWRFNCPPKRLPTGSSTGGTTELDQAARALWLCGTICSEAWSTRDMERSRAKQEVIAFQELEELLKQKVSVRLGVVGHVDQWKSKAIQVLSDGPRTMAEDILRRLHRLFNGADDVLRLVESVEREVNDVVAALRRSGDPTEPGGVGNISPLRVVMELSDELTLLSAWRTSPQDVASHAENLNQILVRLRTGLSSGSWAQWLRTETRPHMQHDIIDCLPAAAAAANPSNLTRIIKQIRDTERSVGAAVQSLLPLARTVATDGEVTGKVRIYDGSTDDDPYIEYTPWLQR